jgi:uncharacterized protein with HEPN domain
MSKRDTLLYIQDALEAIDAIQEYIEDLSFEDFSDDRKTYSATIREYIVIGEAIAHTIDALEKKIPNFPWRAIKDFRNIIIHEYFGVDMEMVWDISTNKLSELKESLLQFKSLYQN